MRYKNFGQRAWLHRAYSARTIQLWIREPGGALEKLRCTYPMSAKGEADARSECDRVNRPDGE